MKYVYLIWTMPVKYFVRARSVTSKHISFVLELFSQEMSVHEEFLQDPPNVSVPSLDFKRMTPCVRPREPGHEPKSGWEFTLTMRMILRQKNKETKVAHYCQRSFRFPKAEPDNHHICESSLSNARENRVNFNFKTRGYWHRKYCLQQWGFARKSSKKNLKTFDTTRSMSL